MNVGYIAIFFLNMRLMISLEEWEKKFKLEVATDLMG